MAMFPVCFWRDEQRGLVGRDPKDAILYVATDRVPNRREYVTFFDTGLRRVSGRVTSVLTDYTVQQDNPNTMPVLYHVYVKVD